MSTLTGCDYNVIILYNFRRGLSKRQCHEEMQWILEDYCPSSMTIAQCYKQFERETFDPKESACLRRCVNVRMRKNIDCVKKLMPKLCSMFVPCLPIDEQKRTLEVLEFRRAQHAISSMTDGDTWFCNPDVSTEWKCKVRSFDEAPETILNNTSRTMRKRTSVGEKNETFKNSGFNTWLLNRCNTPTHQSYQTATRYPITRMKISEHPPHCSDLVPYGFRFPYEKKLKYRRFFVEDLLTALMEMCEFMPEEQWKEIFRMVLEPKFVDYGSIHPTADVPQLQQHNSSHALLSPRSVSLSLPPLDDEEPPNTSSEGKMTQGDLYQRQPLLPNPGKVDKWGHSTHNSSEREYYDEDEDSIIQKSSERNGHVSIDLPPPIREEPRFPQERWKTLLAAIIMFFNFILTLTSLSLVHERVPDRDVYGPLPDVFLDNVPAYDWALDVSEYIIIVCVNSCMIAMVFHKHRFIVFRRIFLIMSLLYMYRAITMYVTVLPISSKTYPCSPKSNETSPLMIAKRVLKLMSGFGLSVNGQHTYCGDFIYSGHTVILVFSYLIISEYTPKKFYLVHWLYWILGCIGVIMLELSHGHYSVDVIIAYYVTTRIFWTYHTLAYNASLKQYSSNNMLSREWWFGMFIYFEGNVGGPLPRQFNWPLPWPRRWHLKSRAS